MPVWYTLVYFLIQKDAKGKKHGVRIHGIETCMRKPINSRWRPKSSSPGSRSLIYFSGLGKAEVLIYYVNILKCRGLYRVSITLFILKTWC